MSFDLVCSNCGAPSGPSVGVCPFCKSSLVSGKKGDQDSPTIAKIVALTKEGRVDRALTMARAAEESRPALLTKVNFIIAYVQILIEVDAPSSKIRGLLAKALLEHPEHGKLLEYMEVIDAKCQLSNEKNDVGEIELANIIRRSPDNAHALFLLGSHLFWIEKDPHGAFKYLERCLRVHPNFLRALACLGVIYKKQNMPGPAKQIFLKCAKLENDQSMKAYFKELAAS